jgi:TatD DNase family protein
VAVGEIGLDGFVPGLDPRARAVFYREQLQAGAPVRPAGDPACAPLGRQAAAGLREIAVPGGIAHAFNGSLQQAQAFIAIWASSWGLAAR